MNFYHLYVVQHIHFHPMEHDYHSHRGRDRQVGSKHELLEVLLFCYRNINMTCIR